MSSNTSIRVLYVMQTSLSQAKRDTKSRLSEADNAYVMKEGANSSPHAPQPVAVEKDNTVPANVKMNFE